MKKRVGFTLVELLAVIAILAILVIIALPNVIEMFNRAKKQSFINELKSIYMAAEQKRIADTLTKSGHTAYARNSSNSCVGKLDLDGRDDIQYYIEFDTEGNVIKYYAKDGSFQYKSDKYGLKKTEITDAESIGSLDEEYIIDITCDGAGGKSNEPVTPEPEPSTPDTEIKYIVKYEPNGGTGSMESQEYTYGVESPLRENTFTRIGYTFNGWNTNPDGNGTSYNDKQIVNNLTNVNNEEIVLYARWKANTITLTAKWNANGSTLSFTTNSTCDLSAVYNGGTQATSCTVTAPTITRSGYSIIGFNTSASATTNNSSYNTSTKKLTLTSSNNNSTWYAITKINDSEKPKCTLVATSSGVEFGSKTDNVGVTAYGMNTTGSAEYNSKTSLSLSNNIFYGYVKDAANNTSSCSIVVSSAPNKKIITTYTCKRTKASFICKYKEKACLNWNNNTWYINTSGTKCWRATGKPDSSGKCSFGNCCVGGYCNVTHTWNCPEGSTVIKDSGTNNMVNGICTKTMTSCSGDWSVYQDNSTYGFSTSSEEATSCSDTLSFTCNGNTVGSTYVTCSNSSNKYCPSGTHSINGNNNYCYK